MCDCPAFSFTGITSKQTSSWQQHRDSSRGRNASNWAFSLPINNPETVFRNMASNKQIKKGRTWTLTPRRRGCFNDRSQPKLRPQGPMTWNGPLGSNGKNQREEKKKKIFNSEDWGKVKAAYTAWKPSVIDKCEALKNSELHWEPVSDNIHQMWYFKTWRQAGFQPACTGDVSELPN